LRISQGGCNPRKKEKDNKRRRSGKIKCDKLIGIYGLEACEKLRGRDMFGTPQKMNVDGASEEDLMNN